MPSDPSATGSAPNGSPPAPQALPPQEPESTPEPPQTSEPLPSHKPSRRSSRKASRGVATVLLALGDSWGAILFLGCTSLLLGAAVVAWPNMSTTAWPSPTTRMIGVLLGAQILLYGLCHLLRAMAAPDVDGGRRVLVALLGIEALVVGVLLVRGLGGSVAVLGLMAGLFWLVAGVIAALSEFVGRARPGRGPAILGGLLAIVASIAVLSYPEASLTVVADVLGGYAAVLGALTIVQAFQVRRAAAVRLAGTAADRGDAAGG